MNKKLKIVIFTLLALIAVTLAIGYFKHNNIPVLEPKGSIGEKEKNLIFFALGLSLIVVVPVYVLLFAFAWHYREGNQKAKYSPELSGNWAIEAVWWLIPSILIVILSVATWSSSHQLDPYRPLASDKQPVRVQVVSLDWKWLFIYPDQNIASLNYLLVPVGRPIDLQLTSDSVMNSFWVPQLGGQVYTMPGMSTQLHLMANKAGSYHGSSANISGKGFAGMDFTAQAASENDFNNWMKSVKQDHESLEMNDYVKLAKPSENNPVSAYSSAPPQLYNSIIAKYMGPMTDHETHDMSAVGGMR